MHALQYFVTFVKVVGHKVVKVFEWKSNWKLISFNNVYKKQIGIDMQKSHTHVNQLYK